MPIARLHLPLFELVHHGGLEVPLVSVLYLDHSSSMLLLF